MWAPAGWDRRRVGARLRAALAGLQELQGLRARQQARVRDALSAPPGPAPRTRAHEQRLQAALQEQLNLLRRQDAGLKTHLDQLDQRISKLQLDVRRTPPEAPDSDSRPSSGFYELSDGGSCSLSASCTSVCSDRLSSSLGTLLPAAPLAQTSSGDCRPWSAHEITVCAAPVPTWGPQATEAGAGRPRPVSTGDLERGRPAEAGLPNASGDPPPRMLDPKYQRDLVSEGGREVYPYPSPLHAVALQSPLFALTKETAQRQGHLSPRGSLPGPPGRSATRPGPAPARAYIERLLRLRGRRNPAEGGVGEQGPPRSGAPPCLNVQREGRPPGDSREQRGPVPLAGTLRPPDGAHRAPGSCVYAGAVPGSRQPGHQPASPAPVAPGPGEGHAGPPTRDSPAPALGRRAHPHFAASRAVPVGLKTGHPTRKAAQTGWGAAPELSPAWGAGLRGRPGRSCSESSLYPVPFLVPLLVTCREAHGASAQALCPWAAAGGEARRRQRRWLSSAEIASRARPPGARGPSPGPPRPAARRARGPRARPRLPRRSESGGSEQSAKGAPLSRCAIGETSDHSTSRFGDEDSSGSGVEGGVRGRAGPPAWPPAAPLQPPRAPAGPRPPLPPVPKLCRIKASKALKKKIRRFQPAALKVMTTV